MLIGKTQADFGLIQFVKHTPIVCARSMYCKFFVITHFRFLKKTSAHFLFENSISLVKSLGAFPKRFCRESISHSNFFSLKVKLKFYLDTRQHYSGMTEIFSEHFC